MNEMSEQPRPVRAWFEYDDAHVFSREMQRRATPEWSDIWESSVHPTGAEGVPMRWYHYNGFEMPGVPTPLRSLRVLLSTGHEVETHRIEYEDGSNPSDDWTWILGIGDTELWNEDITAVTTDADAVARAISEAVAWVSEHEGVKA